METSSSSAAGVASANGYSHQHHQQQMVGSARLFQQPQSYSQLGGVVSPFGSVPVSQGSNHSSGSPSSSHGLKHDPSQNGHHYSSGSSSPLTQQPQSLSQQQQQQSQSAQHQSQQQQQVSLAHQLSSDQSQQLQQHQHFNHHSPSGSIGVPHHNNSGIHQLPHGLSDLSPVHFTAAAAALFGASPLLTDDLKLAAAAAAAAAAVQTGRKKTHRADPVPQSGFKGVSWNSRMKAWLAFYVTELGERKSKTFSTRKLGMDEARMQAIAFCKQKQEQRREARKRNREQQQMQSCVGGGSGRMMDKLSSDESMMDSPSSGMGGDGISGGGLRGDGDGNSSLRCGYPTIPGMSGGGGPSGDHGSNSTVAASSEIAYVPIVPIAIDMIEKTGLLQPLELNVLPPCQHCNKQPYPFLMIVSEGQEQSYSGSSIMSLHGNSSPSNGSGRNSTLSQGGELSLAGRSGAEELGRSSREPSIPELKQDDDAFTSMEQSTGDGSGSSSASNGGQRQAYGGTMKLASDIFADCDSSEHPAIGDLLGLAAGSGGALGAPSGMMESSEQHHDNNAHSGCSNGASGRPSSIQQQQQQRLASAEHADTHRLLGTSQHSHASVSSSATNSHLSLEVREGLENSSHSSAPPVGHPDEDDYRAMGIGEENVGGYTNSGLHGGGGRPNGSSPGMQDDPRGRSAYDLADEDEEQARSFSAALTKAANGNGRSSQGNLLLDLGLDGSMLSAHDLPPGALSSLHTHVGASIENLCGSAMGEGLLSQQLVGQQRHMEESTGAQDVSDVANGWGGRG